RVDTGSHVGGASCLTLLPQCPGRWVSVPIPVLLCLFGKSKEPAQQGHLAQCVSETVAHGVCGGMVSIRGPARRSLNWSLRVTEGSIIGSGVLPFVTSATFAALYGWGRPRAEATHRSGA